MRILIENERDRAHVQRLHAETGHALRERKCATCTSMENGTCKTFGAMPPAEFQVTGCDQWEQWIPF